MCDPYLAGIYARKLEVNGMDVYVTEEFEDGVKKALRVKPAVIVLEIDCVADPAEAIAKIRSSPILQDVKILIVGHHTHYDMIKLIKEKADAYLIFGHFVPSEVIEKINKFHKQYGQAIK